MQWAVTKSWKTWVFETDARLVIDAVQDAGNSPFHLIVKNCISLLKHFEDVQVCYVNRSVNGVANVLA